MISFNCNKSHLMLARHSLHCITHSVCLQWGSTLVGTLSEWLRAISEIVLMK